MIDRRKSLIITLFAMKCFFLLLNKLNFHLLFKCECLESITKHLKIQLNWPKIMKAKEVKKKQKSKTNETRKAIEKWKAFYNNG